MRPFKDLKEFKEKTGLGIGNIVSVRVKQDVFPPKFYLHDGMITGFNYGDKTVCIGGRTYSLETLSKFEYLEECKWLPFGVEETKKPAKFKVGKQYTGTNSNNEQYSIVISAKYRDPKDNKVRVVVSNRFLEEIYTDKDDNERFSLVDDVIKAENEEGEIGF